MQKEGLKILSAEITNFKNIAHHEVNFEGKSAIIIGPNGAGKSSLIQAICSPINAKMLPAEPVKEGEERASIELEIGGVLNDEVIKYSIGMYFSPKHKKGRLVIHDEDGSKSASSKASIAGIVGEIGFDMMDFLRLGRTKDGGVSKPGVREQIDILKKLMPQKVVEKLHAIDVSYGGTYETRGTLNSTVKQEEAKLEGHEFSQEEIEKYSEKKDPQPVKDKISNLTGAIEKYNKAETFRDTAIKDIKEGEETLAELQKVISKKKQDLEKAERFLAKNKKPDIESLTTELTAIDDHNGIADSIAGLETIRSGIDEKKKEVKGLDDKLIKLQDEKKAIFANNPLPVDGLEFDEEKILYNGLPLHDDQIPTSTLVGIGTRIGMAMNPNLRLLVIQDGSLLDKKTMKFILKICEKENYQVLIEKVNEEGGELDVIFTESEIVE